MTALPWSEQDLATLRTQWLARLPIKVIAANLGRTVKAVNAKGPKFGLRARGSTHEAAWSDADRDTLRKLWLDPARFSAAKIGKMMGRTVGSVTSKLARLGLPKRYSSVKKALVGSGRVGHPTPRKVRPVQVVTAPDLSGAVDLYERTGCAYSVAYTTKHLFCNSATGGGSYCAYHKAIMYTPSAPRMQRAA